VYQLAPCRVYAGSEIKVLSCLLSDYVQTMSPVTNVGVKHNAGKCSFIHLAYVLFSLMFLFVNIFILLN